MALQEELRRGENLDDIFTKAPISTTTPTPPRIAPTPNKMDNSYDSYGEPPSRGGMFGGSELGSHGAGGSGGSVFDSGRGRGGGGLNFGGRDRSAFGGRSNGMNCPPGDKKCQRISSQSSGGLMGKPGAGVGRQGIMIGRNGGTESGIGRGTFQGRHSGGGGINFGRGRQGGAMRGGNGNQRGGGFGGRNWRNGPHRGTGSPMTNGRKGSLGPNRYVGNSGRTGMQSRNNAVDPSGSKVPYFQNPKMSNRFNSHNIAPPAYKEDSGQHGLGSFPTTTELTTTTIPPRKFYAQHDCTLVNLLKL